MTESSVSIHQVVQDRYSALAESSSCCADGSTCAADSSCCAPVTLYGDDILTALPDTVTNLSLGCGDPVTIADLQPGEWVLDLGSGGGIDCFLAAQRVGPTGYVIGIDMTPAMLQKATENRVRMGMTNVEFRRGNIEHLPVVAESIDVVMSNCVINLAPQKAPVFAEAFRVLKPGGRISISDIVTEGEFTPELRADTARWAECVTGAIPADDYIALMAAAGFVDVQVVDKTDADAIVDHQPGMPRLFSARITARRPAAS